MRNDQQRRAFAAQFRDEEGLLVFRYRQRGLPIEVSPAERDWAVARFVELNRIAGWSASFSILVAVGLFAYVLPKGFASVPLLIIVYLAVVTSWVALVQRAWNAPTKNWRGRTPVGERLSRVGAWLMRLEQARWRRLLAGAVWSLLLFIMLADGTGPPWTIAVSGLAILVMAATLVTKLGLSERRRWRVRKMSELRRARDLGQP